MRYKSILDRYLNLAGTCSFLAYMYRKSIFSTKILNIKDFFSKYWFPIQKNSISSVNSINPANNSSLVMIFVLWEKNFKSKYLACQVGHTINKKMLLSRQRSVICCGVFFFFLEIANWSRFKMQFLPMIIKWYSVNYSIKDIRYKRIALL